MQQNKTPNQRSIEERIKMFQGLQTKKIIKPGDDKELNCRNLLKDFEIFKVYFTSEWYCTVEIDDQR
jgi:hypothetical protein